jgi:carboxyl-terminal processing protease
LKYTNFKSIRGVPLNPEELVFITESVDTKDQNAESYQELFNYFPDYYSYSEYKGIDWHAEFRDSKAKFENARTPLDFTLQLVRILKKAEDPHLWIEIDGQRIETGKVKITEKNYGSAQIFSILQNKIIAKKFAAITGDFDNIGYIAIPGWNIDLNMLSFRAWGNSKNPLIPTSEVIKGIFSFPNIIIDVRENRGGNEKFARQFASMFTQDSLPYELVKNFNEESLEFDKEHIKWLHPNEEGICYKGNIFVLTSPSIMSSNESFILMMKQMPNAKLVGMKSYGSTANPKPVELSNGVKIFIPSWRAYTLSGELIEGFGIEPDIEIETKPEQFTRESDPLFQEVLKIINNGN